MPRGRPLPSGPRLRIGPHHYEDPAPSDPVPACMVPGCPERPIAFDLWRYGRRVGRIRICGAHFLAENAPDPIAADPLSAFAS